MGWGGQSLAKSVLNAPINSAVKVRERKKRSDGREKERKREKTQCESESIQQLCLQLAQGVTLEKI